VALDVIGYLQNMVGNHDRAIEYLGRAGRLNPLEGSAQRNNLLSSCTPRGKLASSSTKAAFQGARIMLMRPMLGCGGVGTGGFVAGHAFGFYGEAAEHADVGVGLVCTSLGWVTGDPNLGAVAVSFGDGLHGAAHFFRCTAEANHVEHDEGVLHGGVVGTAEQEADGVIAFR
jgi:hypothetical protein